MNCKPDLLPSFINGVTVVNNQNGVNAKRIKQISRTYFDRALKKSGIDDFRFHDFKHTWAGGRRWKW
ncbi:hypothetical protein KKJ05_00555 [Xenorhabdus bovienii]|nr:hypothetical protein [Xenorhabdus bovienii]